MTNLFNENVFDSSYSINSEYTNNIPLSPFNTNSIFNCDEMSQFNFSNFENNIENEESIKSIESIKRNKKIPEQYTFEKIKNDIFPQFNRNEVEKYFIKDDNIINLEKKMSDETYEQPKTRNRGIKLPKEQKKKSGRKRKGDTSDSNHNKYSPDNIIKKIKAKILDYLLKFINKLLYSILDKNTIKSCLKEINISKYEENSDINLIKNIDYKIFINNMKKDSNIKFLELTIGKLLSNKLSTKFKTIENNSNKKIIEELLKQSNEILSFIFNLKLGDWLDVFLYKKNFGEFKIMNKKMNEEQIKIIMNSFQRADELLISICQKFDTIYVSRFICYLYNFERWFLIKIGRKNLKNNNNIHFNISK